LGCCALVKGNQFFPDTISLASSNALTKYFAFYNDERPHQSLGYSTPDAVYKAAKGGGALIIDKYPRPAKTASIALRSTEGTFDEEEGTSSLNTNTENRGSAVQLCVKSSAT